MVISKASAAPRSSYIDLRPFSLCLEATAAETSLWEGEAVSCDAITRWVEEHVGQQVRVSMTAAETNGDITAVMAASGILGYSDGEWTLIDPAPGRQLSCRIGDVQVLILEGAVEDAELEKSSLFIELIGASLTLAPAS